MNSRYRRRLIVTNIRQLLAISLKIYDEVTEGIFDMSIVRIFKEIEKEKRGMFILCYYFVQPSSIKRFS